MEKAIELALRAAEEEYGIKCHKVAAMVSSDNPAEQDFVYRFFVFVSETRDKLLKEAES